MNSEFPLFEALKDYAEESRGYFRIPGHRFQRGVAREFLDYAGEAVFRLDVTETPVTDDLHHPRTVIAQSQKNTAEAFGAEESFYLVNGTTCGNQSMILSCAGEGEEIIIPRNAHKSVMGGLIMGGARPVYAPVDFLSGPGLQGGLSPLKVKEILKDHPKCRGIFTVSPSYHGFCSDLQGLAEIAHGQKIPLLADEAHGAHFYFCPELPAGALTLGVDACAQSLHKTAGALTQSSLLHLKSSLIDRNRVDASLRLTMSTSPSYLLMTSLETAVRDLIRNGRRYWLQTLEEAEELRSEIEKSTGFFCPGKELIGEGSVKDYDPTRLILNCRELNLTGYDLKEHLYRDFRIDTELADEENLLLILTFGNIPEEYTHLVKALKEISLRAGKRKRKGSETGEFPGIPEMALTPRQAWLASGRTVPWSDAAGKTAAEMVAPYPPGIPVIYPGEIMSQEIFEYLDRMKKEGRHFHGPGDKTLSTFQIIG